MKCRRNLGEYACCSVATVVFFGYIGSCFLAFAIVLRPNDTTNNTTGNRYVKISNVMQG